LGCFHVQDVYFFLSFVHGSWYVILFVFAHMSNDVLRGIWM
jgi:hypothetical protein